MTTSGQTIDQEGNKLFDEHAPVASAGDKRDRFQRQIVVSMDEFFSSNREERLVYDYMKNEQGCPETVDELCRRTFVDTRNVTRWLERMMTSNVVERQVTCGVSRYVLTEAGRSGIHMPSDPTLCGNPVIEISQVDEHRYKERRNAPNATCNDLNGNETVERADSAEESSVSTEELEQHLEEGCWVLVNGCDSAEFVAGLANKFPHTSFIVLHRDRKTLVTIMETCMHAEVYNVNFQEGDPASLPNSWIQCFDWVILYDVINDVPDARQALMNTRRVLKKSGVLSLTFTTVTAHLNDADAVDKATELHGERNAVENGATSGSPNKQYRDIETVRQTISDAMFEIIRSDVTNSEEERLHIMCTVNNVD